MAWPPLKERIGNLLDPGYLIYYSAQYFFGTAYRYFILERHFPTSSNFKKVRDDAFSTFWTWFTAPVVPAPPPANSATLIPPLLSHARGVVLDIGPGSGSHVVEFSDNSNITNIFGAEPSVGLHSALRQRIDEAKLTSKYYILNSTAEKAPLLAALSQGDVKVDPEQIFDTIVCIRVLCSVPDLEKTTRELYQLLKPGGQILVVEHIKNPWTTNGSIVARTMQIFYHAIGWKFFLGGCHMNRDTAAALKKAGAWEKVDLKTNFEWSPLTYLSGTLTKPK